MDIEYGAATRGLLDRRIGTRRDDRPIEVSWIVGAGAAEGDDGSAKAHAGRIVNVSVTGAAIEGPGVPRCRVGTRARIRLGGGETLVRVCRFERAPGQGMRYGVEFVDLNDSPQVRNEIFGLLSEGRPGAEAWRDAW